MFYSHIEAHTRKELPSSFAVATPRCEHHWIQASAWENTFFLLSTLFPDIKQPELRLLGRWLIAPDSDNQSHLLVNKNKKFRWKSARIRIKFTEKEKKYNFAKSLLVTDVIFVSTLSPPQTGVHFIFTRLITDYLFISIAQEIFKSVGDLSVAARDRCMGEIISVALDCITEFAEKEAAYQ